MRITRRPGRTATAEPGVALVAGASRGLGLALTRELVGRGWRVHGCSRDLESLERAAASVSGAGSVVAHRCDVRDAAAVEDLVARVWGEEGRLDLALHVAGVIEVGGRTANVPAVMSATPPNRRKYQAASATANTVNAGAAEALIA